MEALVLHMRNAFHIIGKTDGRYGFLQLNKEINNSIEHKNKHNTGRVSVFFGALNLNDIINPKHWNDINCYKHVFIKYSSLKS